MHSFVKNVKPATYLHYFLVLQRYTLVLLSIFLIVGVLSPKQPHLALMMYFLVMSLTAPHQDTLAHTLQKIFGQMHPGSPWQVVSVNASWLLFTYIFSVVHL